MAKHIILILSDQHNPNITGFSGNSIIKTPNLENLASTAKFSGGRKLSKTKLIAAMVRAFRTTGLDVRGVKTDDELLKRITAELR